MNICVVKFGEHSAPAEHVSSFLLVRMLSRPLDLVNCWGSSAVKLFCVGTRTGHSSWGVILVFISMMRISYNRVKQFTVRPFTWRIYGACVSFNSSKFPFCTLYIIITVLGIWKIIGIWNNLPYSCQWFESSFRHVLFSIPFVLNLKKYLFMKCFWIL